MLLIFKFSCICQRHSCKFHTPKCISAIAVTINFTLHESTYWGFKSPFLRHFMSKRKNKCFSITSIHQSKNAWRCLCTVSISNADIMKWKYLSHYWPFVGGIHPVTSGFHSQWTSDVKLWCFLYVSINKLLNKKSTCGWFEKAWSSCEGTVMLLQKSINMSGLFPPNITRINATNSIFFHF